MEPEPFIELKDYHFPSRQTTFQMSERLERRTAFQTFLGTHKEKLAEVDLQLFEVFLEVLYLMLPICQLTRVYEN